MRPLYAARLEHIGPADRVKVECACGHVELLAASAFDGLPSYEPVLDLKHRLRCSACGEKGRVDVSVEWAGYKPRRYME